VDKPVENLGQLTGFEMVNPIELPTNFGGETGV
jgi:hypothetical protein